MKIVCSFCFRAVVIATAEVKKKPDLVANTTVTFTHNQRKSAITPDRIHHPYMSFFFSSLSVSIQRRRFLRYYDILLGTCQNSVKGLSFHVDN